MPTQEKRVLAIVASTCFPVKFFGSTPSTQRRNGPQLSTHLPFDECSP